MIGESEQEKPECWSHRKITMWGAIGFEDGRRDYV